MPKIKILVLILSLLLMITLKALSVESETKTLDELRFQANEILFQTNVSARADIDIVFKLIDRLIQENQLEEAEKYITQALKHFPWNLEYQMIYAEMLAKSGKKEKAEEKANLVFQYAETNELLGRARKLLNKKTLPEFSQISTLSGKNHCVVLVPFPECDKWLVARIKEELSTTLGIPVYIQTANLKYPDYSRDRYDVLLNKIKEKLIEDISNTQVANAMKKLNLTKKDLDEKDNVLKLIRNLLQGSDRRAIVEFEDELEDAKGKSPQWDADKLMTVLLKAVTPHNRKNIAYLGITGVDIYAKDYNFLFGWANRLCGIMSYRRFTADFNDETPNQNRLVKRTVMQCLSSVGLIYGLDRCTDPTCARAYPHFLSEHDAKNGTLCSECKKKFKKEFRQ